MQLDDDAFLVLQIGDRAAGTDRKASCDCRKIATEIRRTGQVVDLALSGNTGTAHVSDRNARELELVLFLVFAVVKRAVSPGVTNANADRAAAKPHVGRWYRLLGNRGRCGRGVSCRHRYGGHKDGNEKTRK